MHRLHFYCHLVTSVVIVHKFNVFRCPSGPLKTDPPSVIHPDAELPRPVRFQRFEPVSGKSPEIVKPHRGIKHQQLSQRRPADVTGEGTGVIPSKQPFGLTTLKRSNHRNNNGAR